MILVYRTEGDLSSVVPSQDVSGVCEVSRGSMYITGIRRVLWVFTKKEPVLFSVGVGMGVSGTTGVCSLLFRKHGSHPVSPL